MSIALHQKLKELERQVQELLQRYHEKYGKYPNTDRPQSLCVYPSDAGCALREIGAIPADPTGVRNYAYWSDGKTYSVAAEVETLPASCSSPAPFESQNWKIVCVTGSITGAESRD